VNDISRHAVAILSIQVEQVKGDESTEVEKLLCFLPSPRASANQGKDLAATRTEYDVSPVDVFNLL
jgi:hypothetical protein